MKRILGFMAILIFAAGNISAAEYWHAGVGVKGTLVIPGDGYENAWGTGVIVSLGDPDSRFSTQFEVDRWIVTYRNGDSTSTYHNRKHKYSGLGLGIFEKFKALGFSSNVAAYLITGLGGYFLELSREEQLEFGGLQMRNTYLHPRMMWANGLGVEAQMTQQWHMFTEGRYVLIVSNGDEDKNLVQLYLGLRYLF